MGRALKLKPRFAIGRQYFEGSNSKPPQQLDEKSR